VGASVGASADNGARSTADLGTWVQRPAPLVRASEANDHAAIGKNHSYDICTIFL